MTPEQNEHVETLTTREEIFDYVESHLKKQSYRSMLDNSRHNCAYRGADGAMCAVGCLIADYEYLPVMEHNSVEDLAGWFTEDDGTLRGPLLPERLIPHTLMLSHLQELHDRESNWTPGEGLSSQGIDHLRDLRLKWLNGHADEA